MSNVNPVVAYTAAVRNLERLEQTEAALKMAHVNADSLTSGQISAALELINDNRHAYQDAINEARMELYANHGVMVDGVVVTMPAGYTVELIEGRPIQAVLYKHGSPAGLLAYDENECYSVQIGKVTGGSHATRWAALRELVARVAK